MSWAKLDDRANEHRKILAAGAEAAWFWACGLMYANRQSARDGFIPDLAITMLFPVKNPQKLAAKLVEVGLWEREGGGYRIHDYHPLNPTKEQYEASLAGGRARAAKSYESRKSKATISSSEDVEVSSREEEAKKLVSSGVVWSGIGSGSDLATTGSTLPVTARGDGLRARAELWLNDPNRAALEHPNPESWPESREIVSVLTQVFGGPEQSIRSAADPRMRVVLSRWSEGYTTDQLADAIRGAGLDDQIRAKPQLQTLTTILRDSGQVDRYARLLSVSPVTLTQTTKTTSGRAGDRLAAQHQRALEARAEEAKALP